MSTTHTPEHCTCEGTLYNNGRWSGTLCKQHARLIAAAPELLEACNFVLGWMQGQHLSPEQLDVLRAAIAKAEGRVA